MSFYNRLSDNETLMKQLLPINESFDLIFRHITIGGRDAFYISVDGLSKDETILRIFQVIQGEDPLPSLETITRFIRTKIGYLETELTNSPEQAVRMILSGAMLIVLDGFTSAILLDTRTYPARSPAEPDLEKVTRGARDGLVETIVFNTALIRRRIRDPRLIYEMFQVGSSSQTDVAVGYIKGMADPHLVVRLREALRQIDTDALLMGEKTLEEL